MRNTVSGLTLFSLLCLGCATEPAEQTAGDPKTESLQSEDGHADHAHDHDTDAANEIPLTGENTQVLFTGTKKSGDNHSGGFKDLAGTITVDDESLAAINVVIQTESLYSDAERLTGHLKNEDFFSVQEFPEMKFESTSIEGEGQINVTGNLTMHGETAEITFPATFDASAGTLTSEFKVDRSKFGMNYTGKPDDPINAEVDIRIIVGGDGPKEQPESAG